MYQLFYLSINVCLSVTCTYRLIEIFNGVIKAELD